MDLYYVYLHKNPTTKEIVYVGMGKDCRAWNTRKGNRCSDHTTFIKEQYNLGFTLQDIVEIHVKSTDKKFILKEERRLIQELNPIYNKLSNPTHWQKGRKLSKETCEFIKDLHSMGYGYKSISYLLGGDNNKAMNFWRAVQYVK